MRFRLGRSESEGPEGAGRDEGVGVDDDDGVGEALGEDSLEGEGEGVPLAALVGVVADEHVRSGCGGHCGRFVGAVVGDDEDAKERARVVEPEQARDGGRDAPGLVVRRNDDIETQQWRLT